MDNKGHTLTIKPLSKCVGYLLYKETMEPLKIMMASKPNWFRRKMLDYCFGLKWVDNVETLK